MMMRNQWKRAAIFVLALAVLASAFGAIAFAATPATGTTETVTVRILGYDAGSGVTILNDYRVRLNASTGYTALAALEAACAKKKITCEVQGSGAEATVQSIAGEAAGYFQPDSQYGSRWAFRVWPKSSQSDPTADAAVQGPAGACTLGSGDRLTWYYDIPASTQYTVMNNYDQIHPFYHSGQTIDVSVSAQPATSVAGSQPAPFAPLAGATVVLARMGSGKVLATATSGADGSAELQVPSLKGLHDMARCRLYVAGQTCTTGALKGGLEQVQSWSRDVLIRNYR
jgi:hypothetical protein